MVRDTIWFNESEIIEIAKECGLKESEREPFLNFLDNISEWIGYCVESFHDQQAEKKL